MVGEGLGKRRSALFVLTVSRTEGNCEYIQIRIVCVGASVWTQDIPHTK